MHSEALQNAPDAYPWIGPGPRSKRLSFDCCHLDAPSLQGRDVDDEAIANITEGLINPLDRDNFHV